MRIHSSVANSAAYPGMDRPMATTANEIGGRPDTLAEGVVQDIRRSNSNNAEAAATEMIELADPILEELVESINRNLNAVDKRLQFLIHEASGRVQLRVLERSTNEVIREVPPEQLLDLVGRIHELIGLLVDETA